jgi:hypothetical protein
MIHDDIDYGAYTASRPAIRAGEKSSVFPIFAALIGKPDQVGNGRAWKRAPGLGANVSYIWLARFRSDIAARNTTTACDLSQFFH